MVSFKIPYGAEVIIKTLNDAGFEAYVVGGCVRDAILGKVPNDWDITTSATPQEVKKLFNRTFDTGIEHGTVTVLLCNDQFEVTTYRIDGKYSDGRHPESVSFTRCLSEDLLRRDFTINAMAYNPTSGLVDLYDGQNDLKNGIIRCVGNPEARFLEDALRILRAIRFSAQLGFEIEEETMKAANKLSHRLKLISAERIREEILKTLLSNRAEKLLLLTQINALSEYAILDGILRIPCVNKYLEEINRINSKMPDAALDQALDTALGKTLNNAFDIASDNSTNSKNYLKESISNRDLSLAVLLSLTDSEKAKQLLTDLKFDNKAIRLISELVHLKNYKMSDSDCDRYAVRKLMSKLGDDFFAFMKYKYSAVRLGISKEDENYLNTFYSFAVSIIEDNEPLFLKDLAINGNDLISLGITGHKIGETLNMLLEEVLLNPKLNEKDLLLNIARG
ncbi:MAG: polynucleotide adenylyltransferase [Lachnospiraceae bacterium]|nr:polynucleotide adenylyltransferase [Lachnospiraceae bacterium]